MSNGTTKRRQSDTVVLTASRLDLPSGEKVRVGYSTRKNSESGTFEDGIQGLEDIPSSVFRRVELFLDKRKVEKRGVDVARAILEDGDVHRVVIDSRYTRAGYYDGRDVRIEGTAYSFVDGLAGDSQ